MKFIVVKRNKLLKWFVVTVSLVLVMLVLSLTDSAGVYSGKTTRKLPIYSVDKQEKTISLSFDACWGADKTDAILETLTSYDIKANFFAVGFWAEKHADKLKTLSDSGRVEIGTHSNTHPNMSKLSSKQMALELETSMKIITDITGKKVDLFRAPYGAYSDNLITEAEKLGLYTIQWDVDSLDWKDLKPDAMADRIIKGARPGSIVLMHNDGKYTVEALPLIIEGLKNRGYSFKTIGDSIYRENFTIDHTGRQIRS